MIAPQVFRHRGYDIVPRRQWSSWCAAVYPQADLPILPRSTLQTLARRKADAIAEAKHAIDRALSRRGNAAEEGRTWQ
jgi:hypothetical protein